MRISRRWSLGSARLSILKLIDGIYGRTWIWLVRGIVDTWRGVSGDLRSGGLRLGGGFGRGDVGGPFEEFSFVEDRAGADQGDRGAGR